MQPEQGRAHTRPAAAHVRESSGGRFGEETFQDRTDLFGARVVTPVVRTVSAGQAIVEVLQAERIRFVFGMPGGHTIGIYDALYDAPAIRHILVRHEQHAACLAAGYAQLTGDPAVVCVTAGPGATNLVTAVAEAFVGALPMIIIAGRGATRNAHRGASQEIDQVTIFEPLTKWAVRVDRPDL